MRVVSWNCCGKFREKYNVLSRIKADIYVVQECENPEKYIKSDYFEFASNYLWIGDNPNKGLGIFAINNIKLEKNIWDTYCLRHFLSVSINDEFDLLGVWACKPYIQEFYIYQFINELKFNKNTVIIGDFNSNAIWDRKQDKRTHSAVVEKFAQKGLFSAYHLLNDIEHGKENDPTFYLYRDLNRGYHIDYAFAGKNRINNFEIAKENFWLEYSDHKPIILELNRLE